jgi:hydroxymethylpyrimidine pyrophosphatase-like HAD family hydrolase
LGISLAQTAAFGDADNDADLLRAAGVGVAVANATPACRAAADFIAPHHDADGVAEGIGRVLGWV